MARHELVAEQLQSMLNSRIVIEQATEEGVKARVEALVAVGSPRAKPTV